MRYFRGQAIENDTEWADRKTRDLPTRWQSRLLGRWQAQRGKHAGDWVSEVAAHRLANIELRETTDSLAVVRIPLDASDSVICQAADDLAVRCFDLASATLAGQKPGPHRFNPVFGAEVPERPLLGTPPMVRAALDRVAMGQGVTPPINNPEIATHVEDGPAIARMTDPQWWRRQLRKVHATYVEGAAIRLGYVHKRADPYVSNESVLRRAQQNERNADALEATTATNEDGQEYTLAELAAKGPANKAIRRAELMTRIAGFERIADDLGHVGLFFTMTCPSRMHKWRTTRKGGAVIENPKYDGTLPNDAQKHLAKTWARIRAAIARRGMHCYGFRIAEPNHDGTPHWHLLVFIDPAYQGRKDTDAVCRFCALVRRYALADSPTERGAKQHRCDFKPIDKGRGSAAGYIAKYVAKNIDGYRLDKDLIGNDAVETSHRVETWASTWRIRQFQQIGGPPVGPWRELRRVKAIPANSPAHLIEAHAAVNKTKALDDLSESQQQVIKGAQWDRYVNAQGGVFCGRRYAIRVEKTEVEGTNKYGEECAPRPIGVSTMESYQPEHMTPARMGGKGLWAVRRLVVESARYVWTITRKAVAAIGGVFNGPLAAPWTCVNNCTRGTNDEEKRNHGEGRAGGGGGLEKGACPYPGHGGGLREPPHGGDFRHQ